MRLFFLFTFLNSLTIFGQDLDQFNDQVQDNMTMYRIRYFIDDTFFCSSNFNDELRNRYLLKSDEEYNTVYVKDHEYTYPDKNVALFTVFTNYYTARSTVNEPTRKLVAFSHGKSFRDAVSEKLLIGIDTLQNRVIYIGGNIFKNCIAREFQLNIDQPNSFHSFLKLKLYNYEIDRISFKKKRRKFLYFEAFSKAFNGKILIKIDREDYDNLKVKEQLNGWTERGAYRW